MYTTSWCGYCCRLKNALKAEGIRYTEIDIEADPAAADFVMSVNGGNQTVPTVKFADGSTLTNPSAGEVKAKLGVAPQSCAAQDSMISRAIDIDPGSSSRDGESLLQSPCSSASRTSARVNHARLGDLAVVERELLLGIADGVEPDHQRPRERPRLAAQVADVASPSARSPRRSRGRRTTRTTRRPRRIRPAARTTARARPSAGPAPRGRGRRAPGRSPPGRCGETPRDR